jgi:hypothetical protein
VGVESLAPFFSNFTQMKRIEKDSINVLAVTVRELMTVNTTNFRFVFIHTQSMEEVEMTLPIDQPITGNTDLFTFFEPADIEFPHTGQYVYRVFDAANELCEEGRAIVIRQQEEIFSYDIDITRKIYE